MALIEHGHGTLLFFQLRTSILTRLMRPGFARTARESWGQLNVKSPHPNVGWKDGAGCHCAVAAHGHMVALLRRSPAQFCDGHLVRAGGTSGLAWTRVCTARARAPTLGRLPGLSKSW